MDVCWAERAPFLSRLDAPWEGWEKLGRGERGEGLSKATMARLPQSPAPAPPPARSPAEPGPARAAPLHFQPRAAAVQVGPARSGRRCSGAPRCACACGSASDSWTVSAASPLRVPGPDW
jgi:hypothetical protein